MKEKTTISMHKNFSTYLWRKDNAFISPISILSALSMTANGAKNNTLSQMENVFGLSMANLNTYLYTYRNQLTTNESNKLHIANTLWFKDTKSLVVESDFLQINRDYYNAEIMKAPFDASTLKDINDWVDRNTDGMIKQILNEIPKDAIMYLINALAFDAKWENAYESRDVLSRNFTKEDGTIQEVELSAAAVTAVAMMCTESCMELEEIKTVYLDRPFVYLIIDCENNLPIFIGTVMNVE